MTRFAPPLLALTIAACTISPEQFRDDQWCAQLDDAAQEPAVSPVGDGVFPDDDEPQHLRFGDFSYTPEDGGRKHIISNEPIGVQVFDASGQFATQVTVIDEHLCDDIARRWIFDLEPQPYFLQLRVGDAVNADSAVLILVDDDDT